MKRVPKAKRHMAAEFDTKSIDATMATMMADPVVIMCR
jgi:hypothetical protein